MRGIDVRQHRSGVIVGVQVRPRSRSGIELTDAGLVIRVKSAPEKGRATEEARRIVAGALDVPSSAITLRTGPTRRRKTFVIEGATAIEVRQNVLAGVGATPSDDLGER